MTNGQQEIELKLLMPVRATPALRAHPLLQGITSRKKWVENLYYDTPAQQLRQQKLALRRRRIADQWLQTVKAPVQELENGLSTRLEWEYPVSAEPTFDFSPIDHHGFRILLEDLAPKLELAFRTDFYRQSWQIQFGQSQIELVLDLGYIRAGKHREAIHELELELLDGDVKDLIHFAEQLQATMQVIPFKPSKAARGYALAAQTTSH